MVKAVEDVLVDITVVLGSANMPIHQLLKMGRGAVIELDSTVEDHAFIYANNRLIARGEIVLVGDTISVSITDTMKTSDTTLGSI